MALPRKLKLMNLFIDGVSYLGVVQSVTLPKLTRKLENYRGGGMNGSATIDFGLDDDALSTEFSSAASRMMRFFAVRSHRRGFCPAAFCRVLPA